MITRYAPNFAVRSLNQLNEFFEGLVSETKEARKRWHRNYNFIKSKSQITK